ncbi:DotU family type IV/VI secretion system protein [Dyella subtropica]|uniref:DotU family type IV/VI secretion system protein n=1 Tax=Dyella subtropica TaxID=2992127 RepID=UPI002255D1E4|nr:DotU family type IV/VI secretion system protein [Dyella subtropica]
MAGIDSPRFLLASFASFYEEVARVKLAIKNKELVRLLQPEQPYEAIEPQELAERVSHRLRAIIDQQSHDIAAQANDAEMEIYRRARYAMVALADEIFILNQPWPAAEYWPEYLLEYAVAGTRIAGRKFFDYVQAQLDCRERTTLDADLAAVLLLALQLGFQGMYRGKEGQAALRSYRAKLYPLASGRKLGGDEPRMFAQAYEHTVVYDRDNTRVALTPWLRMAAYGTVAYLLLSSLVWLVLTWSLLKLIRSAI